MEKYFNSDFLKVMGITGILALAIWAGSNRVWVWGYVHEDMKKLYADQLTVVTAERNEWKSTALNALGVAQQLSPVRMSLQEEPGDITPEVVKDQLNVIREVNDNKHGN